MLPSINLFDAVIYAAALITAFTGFNAGLIRSTVVILGYLSAMLLPQSWPPARPRSVHSGPDIGAVGREFAGVFWRLPHRGIEAIGGLLRVAINDMLGPGITLPDRLAGSALGIARCRSCGWDGLVVVFDRIILNDRQPAILRESSLKPILSCAGQNGPAVIAARARSLHRSAEERSEDLVRGKRPSDS